jgi:hypothetical protein
VPATPAGRFSGIEGSSLGFFVFWDLLRFFELGVASGTLEGSVLFNGEGGVYRYMVWFEPGTWGSARRLSGLVGGAVLMESELVTASSHGEEMEVLWVDAEFSIVVDVADDESLRFFCRDNAFWARSHFLSSFGCISFAMIELITSGGHASIQLVNKRTGQIARAF